jgi:hypothetical protein
MLLAMAAERQLVLFTHDEAVLAWADRRLVAEPHRLVRLPSRDVAPAPAPIPVPVGSAP